MLCQNKFFIKKSKILAKAAEPNIPGICKGELAWNKLQAGNLCVGPQRPGVVVGLGSEGFLTPGLVLQGPGPTLLCEVWSLELLSNPEGKRDLPKVSLPLAGQGQSYLIHVGHCGMEEAMGLVVLLSYLKHRDNNAEDGVCIGD